MNNILLFEEFKDKFVHYINTDESDPIDLFKDYNDILSMTNKPKAAKLISKLLKNNYNKLIRLYHGTSPQHNILDDGLLKTTLMTKKSLQSEPGYTYLSIYPDSAKTFGNIGNGINNAVVYEILVPVILLKPDKDQLYNMSKSFSIPITPTLGNSAIYGHGFRIKGSLPPYMIKKLESPK